MQLERVPSIAWLAKELAVLPEAIRFAANRASVKIAPDDSFLLPKQGAQRQRFFQYLASAPQNPAEQLRAMLGLKPNREIPE